MCALDLRTVLRFVASSRTSTVSSVRSPSPTISSTLGRKLWIVSAVSIDCEGAIPEARRPSQLATASQLSLVCVLVMMTVAVTPPSAGQEQYDRYDQQHGKH